MERPLLLIVLIVLLVAADWELEVEVEVASEHEQHDRGVPSHCRGHWQHRQHQVEVIDILVRDSVQNFNLELKQQQQQDGNEKDMRHRRKKPVASC